MKNSLYPPKKKSFCYWSWETKKTIRRIPNCNTLKADISAGSKTYIAFRKHVIG